MFTKARLTLTLWYVVLLAFVCFMLSTLYYQRTMAILQFEYDRIDKRLQEDQPNPLDPNTDMMPRSQRSMLRRILPADIAQARSQLLMQIAFINGITLVAGSIASYLLAGYTLQPIEQALREQKRFVADAAHELKTPLTALQTSLEVNLLDKKLPSEIKKMLKENLSDVKRLSLLVHSLLDLARPSTTSLTLQRLQLKPLVSQVIQEMSPLSKKAQVNLKVVPIPSNLYVKADERKLQELLRICIDNALKYSPANTTTTIKVESSRFATKIIISDQGIGIDAQDIPFIFDRFYRVDDARTHSKTSGHGLGLSLASKYAKEQHIGISVSSQLSKGTAITLAFRKA